MASLAAAKSDSNDQSSKRCQTRVQITALNSNFLKTLGLFLHERKHGRLEGKGWKCLGGGEEEGGKGRECPCDGGRKSGLFFAVWGGISCKG